MRSCDQSKILYLDEAGIDNRIYREYARAKKGTKVFGTIPGKKRERINFISGLINKKLVGLFAFRGRCNSDVFNHWLKEHLLPTIEPNTIIVMDNVPFHKSFTTKQLIQSAGCICKFLPTYSPDLNKIEHYWHAIKSVVKKLISVFPLQTCLEYAIKDMSKN
jgi:transposase